MKIVAPHSAEARCPRCGTRPPPFRPIPDRPGWVTCSAVFESHKLFFGDDVCGFECPLSWQRLPFVRVGASGVPADGQSTWNVLAHQRLWSLGGVPDAPVSVPPWGLSANVEATRDYQSLLNGIRLPATLPSSCDSSDGYWTYFPSIHGNQAAHGCVVAVKDFAGEIVQSSTAEDASRCQLLDSDGLVVFVDPTKTPDTWLSPMKGFFEDLRARRGVASGPPLDLPVALVVPKIDQLLHFAATVADASRIEGVIHAMRGAGPMNEATTLEAIGRRQRLTVELLRDALPLEDTVARIESVVGRNRVTVFPVAAFGWQNTPLEDLGAIGDLHLAHRWLIENSFGVLDPLLWMIHQHGVYRLPAR